MARPRKAQHRNLPRNLTFDIRYKQYRYRDIVTGKHFPLGKARQEAINTALALNERLMKNVDLVAIVLKQKVELEKLPKNRKKLIDFIDNYFFPKWIPERELSKNTIKDYTNKSIHIKEKLGEKIIDEITVQDISEFLANFPNKNSNRYRSLLSLMFAYAKGEGFTKENPAEVTIKKSEKKDRLRMSYEEYQTIYQKAGEMNYQWMQNAMDIAFITLQREIDILNIKFEDIITEQHHGQERKFLQVIQQKTKDRSEAAYIKIKIGNEFEKVFDRCHDHIKSPYLIHRKPKKIYKSKNRDHFTKVLQRLFIEVFNEVRDATGLFNHLDKKYRPTFHEIRSLGIKSYEDAGVDAQKLAGHSSRVMTDEYKKGYGITWTYTECK